jgi:deoxyribodipyrimidine photo-lyase
MKNHTAIFWFKRDLRVEDNTGLYHAVTENKEVLPVYILEDDILSRYNHSSKRISFFLDALRNLDAELRRLGSYLYVLRGKAERLIPEIIKLHDIQAVYTNRAYGFSGVKRDLGIEHICRSTGVMFKKFEDTFLVPPGDVDQRKVFTPFYKLWRGKKKRTILELNLEEINSPALDITPAADITRSLSDAENTKWPIGLAEQRLADFDFANYEDTRNFPYTDGTSMLSPYIRFGVTSIRKIYKSAASRSPEYGAYISELAWREFWYHIMHYFPETREIEFQEKRRNIKWINNKRWYEEWKEGRTGYPIVDAGMRQLLEEGWIHNRVRMIVASFLTKDLLTDWRWGDKHFSDHLVDYDETVDIGNWQWVASCGADPKPLRIFNPLLQSVKFDPECVYIKKYIPETALPFICRT